MQNAVHRQQELDRPIEHAQIAGNQTKHDKIKSAFEGRGLRLNFTGLSVELAELSFVCLLPAPCSSLILIDLVVIVCGFMARLSLLCSTFCPSSPRISSSAARSWITAALVAVMVPSPLGSGISHPIGSSAQVPIVTVEPRRSSSSICTVMLSTSACAVR